MSEYTGQRKVHACCYTCGKEWEGPNAQGVGVRHARAHKHHVSVEVLAYYIYDHEEK